MATTLIAAIAVTLLVFALVVGARTPSMPVTFKNLDEERAVYGVALWASKQMGIKPGDPRLKCSLYLWAYSSNLNWMGRIPIEELALLSPFIDLIIEGKGPPRNLPAEYEDTRPEKLKRFKERMQTEGLWPQSI
jgi:hypothetical protein